MAKVSEATIGAQFARLTVREIYRKRVASGSRANRWLHFAVCDCECGKQKHVRVERLGITESCGCLRVEHLVTHGLTRDHRRLYGCWVSMVRRCTDQKDQQYRNYGSRGIGVCGEWLKDPVAFCNWAMANGYTDELTLDRRKNEDGYSPDNCRWITTKEQLNNTRKNVRLNFQGECLTLSQWAERTGMSTATLGGRIRNGWSAERALTEPVQDRGTRKWKTTQQVALLRKVRSAAEDLLQAMDGDWHAESFFASLAAAIDESKLVAP